MEIIHRITGEIICESENLSVKELAEQNKSNLSDADLSGADLKGANLEGAHLRGAHLEWAHLEGAHQTTLDNLISLQEKENLRLREKIELAKKFIGQVAEDHQGTMTGTAAKHFLFNYENNT